MGPFFLFLCFQFPTIVPVGAESAPKPMRAEDGRQVCCIELPRGNLKPGTANRPGPYPPGGKLFALTVSPSNCQSSRGKARNLKLLQGCAV
jgi:hypothetical protein